MIPGDGGSIKLRPGQTWNVSGIYFAKRGYDGRNFKMKAWVLEDIRKIQYKEVSKPLPGGA